MNSFKIHVQNLYIDLLVSEPPSNPCNPSPCGPNAQCNNGVCTCISGYLGDPYTICRPECVINTDCSRNEACILHKCRNPCVGTCGVNAECNVVNHLPICNCPRNTTGNAFVSCIPLRGWSFNLFPLFYIFDNSYCHVKLIFKNLLW